MDSLPIHAESIPFIVNLNPYTVVIDWRDYPAYAHYIDDCYGIFPLYNDIDGSYRRRPCFAFPIATIRCYFTFVIIASWDCALPAFAAVNSTLRVAKAG